MVDAIFKVQVESDPPKKVGKVERRMEAAKDIATEVKEAATEVVDELRPKVQWNSLRETLCSEGFDDKRGWRRILAVWGSLSAPFCR